MRCGVTTKIEVREADRQCSKCGSYSYEYFVGAVARGVRCKSCWHEGEIEYFIPKGTIVSWEKTQEGRLPAF